MLTDHIDRTQAFLDSIPRLGKQLKAAENPTDVLYQSDARAQERRANRYRRICRLKCKKHIATGNY